MLKQEQSKKGALTALLCIAGLLLVLVILLENLNLPPAKHSRDPPAHQPALHGAEKGRGVLARGRFDEPAQRLHGSVLPRSGGLHARSARIPTPSSPCPVAAKDQVYYLFGGSAVKFSLPDLFGGIFGSGGFGGAVSLVLSVLVALILAGCVAALFAWLIGLPVLRLKSDYLAIATLGFAEILRAIFQWQKLGPVTNGANMIKSFPTFTDFNISGKNGSVVLYLSTFVPFLIAIICIAIIVLLINSTYGRAFKAIRDDEVAAEAMGINLAKHKMLSFVTSSFFAGVGGALFAMYVANAQAKVFTATMTYEILLIVVIGGIGSISGSCIATFLYVACSEWWLRFLDSETFIGNFKLPLLRSGFRMVVFSVVIMIVVLFFRKGIMGDRELPDLICARRAKRAAKAAKKEEASK